MEFLPLSLRRSSARNVPSGEERGKTDAENRSIYVRKNKQTNAVKMCWTRVWSMDSYRGQNKPEPRTDGSPVGAEFHSPSGIPWCLNFVKPCRFWLWKAQKLLPLAHKMLHHQGSKSTAFQTHLMSFQVPGENKESNCYQHKKKNTLQGLSNNILHHTKRP